MLKNNSPPKKSAKRQLFEDEIETSPEELLQVRKIMFTAYGSVNNLKVTPYTKTVSTLLDKFLQETDDHLQKQISKIQKRNKALVSQIDTLQKENDTLKQAANENPHNLLSFENLLNIDLT